MGSLGFQEILLILLVVVLLFGGRKLPELGRGLGEGLRNFRKSMGEGGKEGHQGKEEQDKR